MGVLAHGVLTPSLSGSGGPNVHQWMGSLKDHECFELWSIAPPQFWGLEPPQLPLAVTVVARCNIMQRRYKRMHDVAVSCMLLLLLVIRLIGSTDVHTITVHACTCHIRSSIHR